MLSFRSIITTTVSLIAVAGVALSCGGGDGPTPSVPVASVSITPGDDATLPVGQSRALSATTADQSGGVLNGRSIVWSVSGSPAVAVSLSATTGASVTATGATAGTATVTATSEGKTDQVTFTVTGATPTTANVGTNDVSNSFTPSTVTIRVGGTVTFTIGDLHNVEFEDASIPDLLTLGQDGARTFNATGTFRFRCQPHSGDFDNGMVGRVVVVSQ
jgi:plastocyanin